MNRRDFLRAISVATATAGAAAFLPSIAEPVSAAFTPGQLKIGDLIFINAYGHTGKYKIVSLVHHAAVTDVKISPHALCGVVVDEADDAGDLPFMDLSGFIHTAVPTISGFSIADQARWHLGFGVTVEGKQ